MSDRRQNLTPVIYEGDITQAPAYKCVPVDSVTKGSLLPPGEGTVIEAKNIAHQWLAQVIAMNPVTGQLEPCTGLFAMLRGDPQEFLLRVARAPCHVSSYIPLN